MSSGESIFSAGFIQKITKEDLNIKRDHGITSSWIHEKVLLDIRGLHTKGGDWTVPGWAGWPHPCVARPLMVGSHHELLDYSSTSSKDASQSYVKSVCSKGSYSTSWDINKGQNPSEVKSNLELETLIPIPSGSRPAIKRRLVLHRI
jgi:hypothetical protein